MEVKKTGTNAPADAAGLSDRAARWSDPKLAAQRLLSPSPMPGLFVTDPLEHLQGSLEGNWDPAKRPRGRSDDNALESAGAPVDPAAAARWSDPKLAAQRLLSPSPMPGLFVADPLEHLQGSLEGNWDPAKHSRDDSDDNVMESAGPPVDPSPGGTLERS